MSSHVAAELRDAHLGGRGSELLQCCGGAPLGDFMGDWVAIGADIVFLKGKHCITYPYS